MAKPVEIEIKTNADKIGKSFEDLKKDIKETEDSLASLTKQFGANSTQAAAAASKLNTLKTSYDALNKSATDLNATFEQTYGELQPLSTRLGEVEDRLYELALAGKANTQEFRDLQAEGVRFRSTIIEVDKGIDLLAENKGLGVISGGISQLGDQLGSLDFTGAANTAKQLAANIKGIDPKTITAGIKGLAGTIGQLGNAFLQMGLKLLANPIFLFAAIIVAVVAAIVLLKDKVAILGQAFDFFAGILKGVVQIFKDLGDAIGLTSFADDEATEKAVANAKKRQAAAEQTSNIIASEYDRIIAINKAEGKSTVDLEIAKQKAIDEYAKKQIDALNVQLAATLGLKAGASKEEVESAIRTAKELIRIQEKYGDDNIKLSREQIKQIEKFNSEETQELLKGVVDQDQVVKGSIADRKVIRATAAADAAKKSEENRKKAKEAAEKYAADRLKFERQIIDLQLANMEDGFEKEFAILEENRRRRVEDINKDSSILPAERKKLIALIGQQTKQAEEKLYRDEAARRKEADAKRKADQKQQQADLQEHLNKLKEYNQNYNDFILEKTGTESEKRRAAIKKDYAEQRGLAQAQKIVELSNLENTEADKLAIKLKYANKLKTLNKLQDDELKKESADTAKSERDKLLGEIGAIVQAADAIVQEIGGIFDAADEKRLKKLQEQNDAELAILDDRQQKELSKVGLTESQKDAINRKYEKLRYAQELATYKKEQELKKKQFARDKAFKILGAVANTAVAVTSALTAGPGVGIALAALTAALGAVQIGIIASQKYEGESGPSAPATSSPSGGAGGAGSEPTTPEFQVNTNSNNNNVTGQSAATNRQPEYNLTVNAIVSEVEMTATQNRVARIQRNAEL